MVLGRASDSHGAATGMAAMRGSERLLIVTRIAIAPTGADALNRKALRGAVNSNGSCDRKRDRSSPGARMKFPDSPELVVHSIKESVSPGLTNASPVDTSFPISAYTRPLVRSRTKGAEVSDTSTPRSWNSYIDMPSTALALGSSTAYPTLAVWLSSTVVARKSPDSGIDTSMLPLWTLPAAGEMIPNGISIATTLRERRRTPTREAFVIL